MLVESLGSKELLFVSFWISIDSPKKLSKIKLETPEAFELLNAVNPSTLMVHEWLDQGCPPQ
jgi:hypothetical protein